MEITANAIQLVQPNNDVMFTDTAVPGCPSIIHREGSGLVTLRGLTQHQCRARFRVFFGANMAVPATETTPVPISLAVSMSGEPIQTTTMIVSSAVADRYFNVSTSVFLDIPVGCCSQIAVKNTSTIPVSVQNANLIVERVA